MATEEIPPGSVLSQVPSEPPADPQLTESSTSVSPPSSTPSISTAKPYKLNSSSPSPVQSQVPLQVHVPAGLAGHPHARSGMPGGLLAQSPYASALPAGQAGLMPLPYGQQLMAAGGMPRMAAMQQLPPGYAAAQPMMLPGGGLIRHQRRTMQPVVHPYQRVAAAQMPGVAAQPAQSYQMLAAARQAVQPQQQHQAVQTPYGQMLIPVSAAGLQYQIPGMHQAAAHRQPAPTMAAMDPTTAALYGQYQASFQPYLQQLQQLQHPGMAALAASQAAYAGLGVQQQYYRAAQDPQQQLAAAYDQQKLLNAQYAQVLMPAGAEQNNMSPATANGTSAEYSEEQ